MKISHTSLVLLTLTALQVYADEPPGHLPSPVRLSSVQRQVSSPQSVLPPVTSGMPGQQPCLTCDDPNRELEFLALDIARRSVLAHYPKAGGNPMKTLEVRVRPQGDMIHTYARVSWSQCTKNPRKFYESEVFASLVYTPDLRRIFDISYKDNRLQPWRMFNRRVDLVSKLNEDLERRDPLRMATPLVGNRQDVLVPRDSKWMRHRLRGDHAWHATTADDYIAPRWRNVESPFPTR